MRQVGVAVGVALALGAFPAVAGADPDALQSSDRMGLTFEESSVPAPEGQTTTVTVRTADGKVAQVITEPYKGWWGTAPIELNDLDQDGRDDLLVQIDGRVTDHRWAIWHATGESTKFSRVGVVSGHPESAGGGLIRVPSEQSVLFYVIKGGALTPVPAPATPDEPA